MKYKNSEPTSLNRTHSLARARWGIMAAAVVSLALGFLYATGATALDNGVGKLPALGFNSKFHQLCSNSDTDKFKSVESVPV